MSIEAMKQWLEALEYTAKIRDCQRPNGYPLSDADKKIQEAIASLRQAIAESKQDEPWDSSDTAHRPGGLPQDFISHEVEYFDEWSDWVCPKPEQYFMKCCDCGLVHEMQFRVAKYSDGDECEFIGDADLQAVFRARRTTPPRAWVGLTPEERDEICLGDESIARSVEAKLKEKNA